jgi:parallel beta-helix repeat protein
MMIGVFSVYARGAYVADNDVEDTYVGIYIHDRSDRNVVTGNTVENSKNGVLVFGRSSYVAENVVAHNEHGLVVQASIQSTRRTLRRSTASGCERCRCFR